jgi:hypothetical protein
MLGAMPSDRAYSRYRERTARPINVFVLEPR